MQISGSGTKDKYNNGYAKSSTQQKEAPSSLQCRNHNCDSNQCTYLPGNITTT